MLLELGKISQNKKVNVQGLCLWAISPYPSVLDFWKIKFEKSSSTNWFLTCKNQFRNWFFQAIQYTGSKNPVHRTWFFNLIFLNTTTKDVPDSKVIFSIFSVISSSWTCLYSLSGIISAFSSLSGIGSASFICEKQRKNYILSNLSCRFLNQFLSWFSTQMTILRVWLTSMNIDQNSMPTYYIYQSLMV